MDSCKYVPVPCLLHGVEIPTRIFVGNLPYETKDLELKTFFEQFGSIIDARVITDRSGFSKGYGFVTFKTESEAKSVLNIGRTMSFKDKEITIAKAIRRQSGQYEKPNREFVNGLQQISIVAYSGNEFTLSNGRWEPINSCLQPSKPFYSPVYPVQYYPPASPSVLHRPPQPYTNDIVSQYYCY